MKLTRDFYIPKGAIKIADKSSDAVVYVRTCETRNKIIVKAFHGKRSKPDFHYSYKDAAGAEKAVQTHFANVQAARAAKAARRAEMNKPHSFEVGAVLTGSWGYDQTNVEAYQVVEIVGKSTIKVRKIGLIALDNASGFDSQYVVPNVDGFVSDEILTKRVTYGTVKVGHCRLSMWEGGKLYSSWYH